MLSMDERSDHLGNLDSDELNSQYHHVRHSLQSIGGRTIPIWTGQIGECIELSTQEMSRLTEQFSGIVDNLNSISTLNVNELERASNEISQGIGRILVSLQFQDRVSQILGHVQHNMGLLSEEIEDQKNLDMDKFIKNMVTGYTTTNERETHHALTGTDLSDAPKASDDSEVVFF
ncbi:MAG: hypothetical protein OEL79_10030 [Chromatiales bacterium]|nr:hypothetical protein [Chromatiales bacterium]